MKPKPEVAVFVYQRSDISGVVADEAGIGLVDEHHRVAGDILHDTSSLLRCQTVTCGVVGRCQQQHAGMHAVGVFNHLVYVVSEGVFLLVQGVHLESTATL